MNKLHVTRIKNTYAKVDNHEKEQSELMKTITERDVKWKNTGDQTLQDKNILDKIKYQAIERQKHRDKAELLQDIDSATRFNEEISKETDEKKFLEMINDDDIKKSSIFNLEELWTRFDTSDGITKVVCITMFSSYFILSCVFGITVNLYGNYLLERFKLEEKYPKIAIFIEYRQKASKYYIISNLIFIVIVCLMNLVFGLSVLSILYT